jgi:RNA polymerase sigma factor (sigma-70 family)
MVSEGPSLMSTEVRDGDLVLLARDGDQVAFRLLVERHQPMARARARRLCGNPSDVDDVVQESFLQAFIALDRLRDPDRFAGWLAGIVLNVCRRLQRHPPLVLLADWPEPLHPATAHDLPSADDLDRADAVRAAVADLPAGQRRAVALHYYADLPAGQIAEPPDAARASLYKARLKLRAYISEHRPDLVPTWRTPMTTVRIAGAERRIPPGPEPIGVPTHVILLADDTAHRVLPIWLQDFDSVRLARLFEPPSADHERAATAPARTVDELTAGLLRAADLRVTGVDIDELGPEVAAARIALAGPSGTQHVTARVAEGLAVAVTAGAPVRVADGVMSRLAVPLPDDDSPVPLPEPQAALAALRPGNRPRYEPRNLDFADGLRSWLLSGSFIGHASHSHWQDYSCAAGDGVAVLSAAVPQPSGFASLGQEIFADDYRGTTVTFGGEFRTRDAAETDPPSRAGLFLRVVSGRDSGRPSTARGAASDPANSIVTISADRDWTSHRITVQLPDSADNLVFGVFLVGRGRIEMRNAELVRGA